MRRRPEVGDTEAGARVPDGVIGESLARFVAWSGSTGPYDEAGRLTAPLAPGYAGTRSLTGGNRTRWCSGVHAARAERVAPEARG